MLHTLASMLEVSGRHPAGLAAIEESVAIFRRLASARPGAHEPNLAKALNNLSIALASNGRDEEALKAIEETVALRRRLAGANPDAHSRGSPRR